MRLLFAWSSGLFTVTTVLLACGGSTDATQASDGGASPSSSSSSGNGNGSSGHDSVDCVAACPNIARPTTTASFCSDGTLATSACGPIAESCGYFETCPANAAKCFLANTPQPGNPPIPPDGGPVGAVDPTIRACTEASDCATVEVTTDCCGTVHVAGVSTKHVATLTECAANRKASYTACRCPASRYADDRSEAPSGAPRLTCDRGRCTTSFLP